MVAAALHQNEKVESQNRGGTHQPELERDSGCHVNTSKQEPRSKEQNTASNNMSDVSTGRVQRCWGRCINTSEQWARPEGTVAAGQGASCGC